MRTIKLAPGPIFGNIISGDEINRASAKVQAALPKAMEERQVTVAGTTHPMEPLLILRSHRFGKAIRAVEVWSTCLPVPLRSGSGSTLQATGSARCDFLWSH